MRDKIKSKLEWLGVFAACSMIVLAAWACAMMMVGAFLGEEPTQPSEAQVRVAIEALEMEGE